MDWLDLAPRYTGLIKDGDGWAVYDGIEYDNRVTAAYCRPEMAISEWTLTPKEDEPEHVGNYTLRNGEICRTFMSQEEIRIANMQFQETMYMRAKQSQERLRKYAE